MKLIEAQLDYTKTEPGHVYIFTANSIVYNGDLCMGGGAALAAREAYPGVETLLGAEIEQAFLSSKFGFVVVPYNDFFVGAFQTKVHYRNPSYLDLIETASRMLGNIARDNPGVTYHLNYPGIGLGGLRVEDVQPIIEKHLPDNVIVYKWAIAIER